MTTFQGLCRGGPLDDKYLAHWERTKKFFRPMTNPMAVNPQIEAVTIGQYYFNDFNEWMWQPTAEGKALDTLYGPAALPQPPENKKEG